ncbi:MAG TPA: thioesterase family protein [Anaerolineales bacterium]|jgi:acyl-CoA thioester hydrolase
MDDFRFWHEVEVRFADIDSLGHVNNAMYFTYMETARAAYFGALELWDRQDMQSLGVILAHAACDFRRPIGYGQSIRVGVAASRLGTKSFDLKYRLTAQDGELFAEGVTTMVHYDYQNNRSVAMPDRWRRTLAEFDGLPTAAGEDGS